METINEAVAKLKLKVESFISELGIDIKFEVLLIGIIILLWMRKR